VRLPRSRTLLVRYDAPLFALRSAGTTVEEKGGSTHTEVVELPMADPNRSIFERWFLDR